MKIDLDELREAVELMRELERLSEKLLPVLELLKDNKSLVVPCATERFLELREVCKIFKVGSNVIRKLVEQGHLTRYYIADSSSAKYRLSEVERVPLSTIRPTKGTKS